MNPPIRILTNIALVLNVPLEAICELEWFEWTVFEERAPKPRAKWPTGAERR